MLLDYLEYNLKNNLYSICVLLGDISIINPQLGFPERMGQNIEASFSDTMFSISANRQKGEEISDYSIETMLNLLNDQGYHNYQSYGGYFEFKNKDTLFRLLEFLISNNVYKIMRIEVTPCLIHKISRVEKQNHLISIGKLLSKNIFLQKARLTIYYDLVEPKDGYYCFSEYTLHNKLYYYLVRTKILVFAFILNNTVMNLIISKIMFRNISLKSKMFYEWSIQRYE